MEHVADLGRHHVKDLVLIQRRNHRPGDLVQVGHLFDPLGQCLIGGPVGAGVFDSDGSVIGQGLEHGGVIGRKSAPWRAVGDGQDAGGLAFVEQRHGQQGGNGAAFPNLDKGAAGFCRQAQGLISPQDAAHDALPGIERLGCGPPLTQSPRRLQVQGIAVRLPQP